MNYGAKFASALYFFAAAASLEANNASNANLVPICKRVALPYISFMGSKHTHDQYGKQVMAAAFGQNYDSNPQSVSFGLQAGNFKIDGTIGDDIAVEIESRTSKQVRGAVLDIISHPHPKKLILLISKYNNGYTEKQCQELLKRFAPQNPSVVITLKGNGGNPATNDDVKLVQLAVKQLRDGKKHTTAADSPS